MDEPITLTGRAKEREDLERREQRALRALRHFEQSYAPLLAALARWADDFALDEDGAVQLDHGPAHHVKIIAVLRAYEKLRA